jgi:hypothetical protein
VKGSRAAFLNAPGIEAPKFNHDKRVWTKPLARRTLTHSPAQSPLQPCSIFNTLSVLSVWPSRGKIFSTQ